MPPKHARAALAQDIHLRRAKQLARVRRPCLCSCETFNCFTSLAATVVAFRQPDDSRCSLALAAAFAFVFVGVVVVLVLVLVLVVVVVVSVVVVVVVGSVVLLAVVAKP